MPLNRYFAVILILNRNKFGKKRKMIEINNTEKHANAYTKWTGGHPTLMSGSCRHFSQNHTISIQMPSHEYQTVSSAITAIAVAKVINWNHNEGNRRKSIESEITNKEKLSFKSIWLKSSILMELEMAVSFRNSMVHNSLEHNTTPKAIAAINALFHKMSTLQEASRIA